MLLRKLFNLIESTEPLESADVPVPVPGDSEILISISACGVCHTELDEIEGRTPPSIPGVYIPSRTFAVNIML